MLKILLAIVCIIASLPSSATIYFATGTSTDYGDKDYDAKDKEYATQALGYFPIHSSGFKVRSLGFDIGSESKFHDTTFNRDVYSNALSFNVILPNLFEFNGNGNDDGSLSLSSLLDHFGFRYLGGFRVKSESCERQSEIGKRQSGIGKRQSEIVNGYGCFANVYPKTKYTFNYGTLMYIRFDGLNLGVRTTAVSKQVFFGVDF
jgi:hypothetical protein